jgi:hypothetical protein
MHDELLNLPDMRGVQDHVATITKQALAVRPLHPVDEADNDKFVIIEHVAEFAQAWRRMIDSNLMDRIALSRGHIHSDKKTHFILRF